MTCLRAEGLGHDDAVRQMLRGDLAPAVSLGMGRLERRPEGSAEVAVHAVFGQAVGRALIELGREEEAEELFRRQVRVYELDSRSQVRWMSSLDHGVMQLTLHRPGRAAEAFNTLADDESAPQLLRIEALAGLAVSLRSLGEYGRAQRLVAHAATLVPQGAHPRLAVLLRALALETTALRRLRSFDEAVDLGMAEAMHAKAQPASAHEAGLPLAQQLQALSRLLVDMPAAAFRLEFLANLTSDELGGVQRAGALGEALADLRRRKLAGHERSCRIEGLLALVEANDGIAAHELLHPLAHDEGAVRRHRHSLELRYCLSRIYALQGRHIDAYRLYKEHVAQALARLRQELAHLPYPRCLEKEALAARADAMQLQLPLRYRRAYQYIVDHLDDRGLSVREIAAHIDVTERALQMAFRNHLGITPAELIRRRRMEHIRRELRESPDRNQVFDVAQRWGMSDRSTVTQHYRQLFNETPSMMLRGGAAGDPPAGR